MMDVREETSGETGRHQWNKEPRLKEQLHLRKERTPRRIFGKTIGLEIVKQTVESSFRIRKTSAKHCGGAGHL
jgi:hypothetical protein